MLLPAARACSTSLSATISTASVPQKMRLPFTLKSNIGANIDTELYKYKYIYIYTYLCSCIGKSLPRAGAI